MALDITINKRMLFNRGKHILGDPEADMSGGREVIDSANIIYEQALGTFFLHLPTFFGNKLSAQGSLGNLLLSL